MTPDEHDEHQADELGDELLADELLVTQPRPGAADDAPSTQDAVTGDA